MSTNQITELVKNFKALKEKSEDASKQLKEINSEWDVCESELLDAMVNEGMSSVKVEGIGQASFSTKNYLSVTADNKPQFFQYLKESDNDGILKLDVNPRTLGAFLDSHLEQLIEDNTQTNTEECDPITARNTAIDFLKSKGVSAFMKRTLSFRGAK